MKHEELTNLCIRAYYNVYNTLGYGFLEKVYENALVIELRELGATCRIQQPITAWYHGKIVGNYFADVIVNDIVIIEIKTIGHLLVEHEAQLVNYLRATDIEVGLLFNFGKLPKVKRKLFENEYKTIHR